MKVLFVEVEVGGGLYFVVGAMLKEGQDFGCCEGFAFYLVL